MICHLPFSIFHFRAARGALMVPGFDASRRIAKEISGRVVIGLPIELSPARAPFMRIGYRPGGVESADLGRRADSPNPPLSAFQRFSFSA